MPTPKAGYFLADGSRVPGVTTIIGYCKIGGIEPLLSWANRMGLEGKSHRDERDKAADAGTLAHAMIERDILGHTVAMEGEVDLIAKATSAYGAYCEWATQSRLEIIGTEMGLVSERHKYGGTPDAIGKINGRVVLLDWKTSNSVYADHLIQLAAYKALVEECTDWKIEGFHLCRFAKEHGDFAHHYYPDLSEAWDAFLHMRALYEIGKQLKKRAA